MSSQDGHHDDSDYRPVAAATSTSRMPLSEDAIAPLHDLTVAAAASIGALNVFSGYAAKPASLVNAASAAETDCGGSTPSTVDGNQLRRSLLSGVSDSNVADDGNCGASVKFTDSAPPLPQPPPDVPRTVALVPPLGQTATSITASARLLKTRCRLPSRVARMTALTRAAARRRTPTVARRQPRPFTGGWRATRPARRVERRLRRVVPLRQLCRGALLEFIVSSCPP